MVNKYYTHILSSTELVNSVNQENHLHHHEISKHFSVSEPTHNVLTQSYIKIKNWNRDFRPTRPNKVESVAKQRWPYLESKTNIHENDPYIQAAI